MSEDPPERGSFRASLGLGYAVTAHACPASTAAFVGGVLAALAVAAVAPWMPVSVESVPKTVVAFVIVPAASTAGLTWVYSICLREPTASYYGPHMHEHCREFVHGMLDDPEAAERWARAPLSDRTRRWLAVVALAAPVAVFVVAQIDSSLRSDQLGVLLAVGTVRLARRTVDTVSLRPLSRHLRYFRRAAPPRRRLPLDIAPAHDLCEVPVSAASVTGFFVLVASFVAACVSGHCAVLLYDGRKMESGDRPAAAVSGESRQSAGGPLTPGCRRPRCPPDFL